MKKLNVLFAFVFLFAMSSMAQSTGTEITVDPNDVKGEWQSVTTINGIQIDAKRSICPFSGDGNNQELILLKVTNTSNAKQLFRFNKEMYNNGKCSNCTPGSTEYLTTLTLAPGQSIESNCNNYPVMNTFIQFTQWENKTVLTKLVLTELQATEL